MDIDSIKVYASLNPGVGFENSKNWLLLKLI